MIGDSRFHRWRHAERLVNASLKHEIRFRETFGIGLWACTNSTGACPNNVSCSFWATTSGQARNTTVQVWTVEEGFGIGRLFRQTCCAANNFRDHEVVLFHCSGNCASVREFGGTTRTVMKSGFRLAQESASRFVSKNRSITIAFRS